MDSADIARPASVTENNLRKMICNSMAVNILERLLGRCLFALGWTDEQVSRHWENSSQALEWTALMVASEPVISCKRRRRAC